MAAGGGPQLLAMQYPEGAAPIAAARGYLIYPAPMGADSGSALKLEASAGSFVTYPKWMHKSDTGSATQ